MLGPRLNIVHSVWITRHEADRMAAAGAGIVLNHLSNLKLKSGIAPVCDLRDSGVRLGLGLRQLQRQRRAKRIPGHEDVLPAGGRQRAGAGAWTCA